MSYLDSEARRRRRDAYLGICTFDFMLVFFVARCLVCVSSSPRDHLRVRRVRCRLLCSSSLFTSSFLVAAFLRSFFLSSSFMFSRRLVARCLRGVAPFRFQSFVASWSRVAFVYRRETYVR